MASKREKIVIDTSIFISFLISDSFKKFDKYLETNKVKLLFSEELLNEFIEVVNRPKLKKYFTQKDVSNLFEGIENYAELK